MIQTNGLGRSFDGWAGEYDRYRPTYPETLFTLIGAELGLPERPEVLDVGAGTGRASIAMARLGWRVTAVEPGEPMLDVLRAGASAAEVAVHTVQATAEETGCAPRSVDLVTAAQAFHWFDRPAALTEMARVIRPGGGAALFWNVRDETRSAFVADYHRILERYGGVEDGKYLQAGRSSGRSSTRKALEQAAGFGPPLLHELWHELQTSPEAFVGMAFTASYVQALPTTRQAAFRAELTELLARHGHAAVQPFAIPYRIDCWIAQRTEKEC